MDTALATLDLHADRERALELVPARGETVAKLESLVELILDWQRTTNLIAPSTISELWTRHVADSLQLLLLDGNALRWADFGSGGGFPGLVLACAAAERPGITVQLVESNGKKAAFLREAVRRLALPALVHAVRIEDFNRSYAGSIDIVTARALAPLTDLLAFAEPWLAKGGKVFFPKGRDVEAELAEAKKSWRIAFDLLPSRTQANARIVVVRSAQRLAPAGQRAQVARAP